MQSDLSRRGFLGAAGVAMGTAAVSSSSAEESNDAHGKKRIIAIACSPRKGKTTAQALTVCLEAAQSVAPELIEIELIELAGLDIPAELAAGLPLPPGRVDDFPAVAAKLSDPRVIGIIIGTPVYFANMTALCKAFIDRCGVFRKNEFALSSKVAGVLAVGGVRSGGQDITIQSVQASLMCHEMLIVGDARPTGHFGARLWNDGEDDISKDEFGIQTATNLGKRVAEVALQQK